MALPEVDVTINPALVPSPTVEINDVSKWFGQKVAVSNVTCSFGPGVTGLLGPNGAGKTTMLRMLTGLLRPSRGGVRVLDAEPRSHPSVYENVGLVPEEAAVYPGMTAREYVRYAAVLNGTEKPDSAARRAIGLVRLEDAADRKLGGYSKGMRQRAKVAAALISNPEILLLDEPLNGTDPVQRLHLIDLFREFGADGRTVIVSSHVLEEVERVSDRVIAIVDGKLAAAGDVAAIRRAMSDIPYQVRVETDRSRVLAARLLEESLVHGVSVDDGTLIVETADLAALGRRVPVVARDAGAKLTMFQPQDASLESVFRYLVGKR
ncbi:MAG: ABC transporter ATP-binding protein [Actinomycetota bacterium]